MHIKIIWFVFFFENIKIKIFINAKIKNQIFLYESKYFLLVFFYFKCL